MKYHEYLNEYLFTPLQMNRTGFHFIDQEIINFSHLYDVKDGTTMDAIPYDMRKASGAGGLYSNIHDLYKWGLGLINHTILSKELKDAMFSIQTPINETGGYGYGVLSMFDEGNHTLVYHPGNGPGVFAQNMIIENDIQIILLSNINDRVVFQPCFNDILQHVTNTLL
jgi:CubicO group peptidase (beta-lactamase class C family)